MFLLLTLAHAAEPIVEDNVVIESIISETESALHARFHVDATPAEVESFIADVERFPKKLPPISAAEMLAPDVLHLTISLPWPMAARDSVSRISRRLEADTMVFAWEPTEGPPPAQGVIRLERSRGEWRLTPAEGGTDVTYTSYNQVPANVPVPILKIIHKMEGTRLASNLREALEGG